MNDKPYGKYLYLIVAIGLFSWASVSNVLAGSVIIKKQHLEANKMKTIPPVFAKVFSEISPTGSVSNADACLPEELRDWLNDSRGIFISAPNKIITNGNYVFPLCGGYRLSKKTLNQFKNTSQELAVVVVDAKTHKSYATNLIDKNLDAEYPDNKKSEGDSNELEKLTASETFAINIYHYLPDLPKNPGNYLIYVILGDNKSNVISVEILDHE